MYRLLFLLAASFISAQNYRFVYEYKMKPDAGKMEMLLKDGYITQFDYNELKKSGADMDAVIAGKLRLTNNSIEKE